MRNDRLHRRDFLRGGAAAAGVSLLGLQATAGETRAKDRACIFLLLTGGPGQLDTFDPKPDAPAEIRGPFASIPTSVPGVRVGEHLPRLASLARQIAFVRSVHHDAAAVHETGMQLLQTGRLQRGDAEAPHFGAVLARLLGPRRPGVRPFVLLPGPLENTGLNVGHGQGAGDLGDGYAPAITALEPPTPDADRYGVTPFGRACAQACRLVEQGVRCVTVNMFTSLADEVTWDCHADRRCHRSSLDDYARTLCPTFDLAYSALLEDLTQRGLLDSTLVVAAGEFGRTPRLNVHGGRDHWPGVWSLLLAGGGVCGGQVVGASDRLGAEPVDRPVRPPDVLATIYRACGVEPAGLVDGAVIEELI